MDTLLKTQNIKKYYGAGDSLVRALDGVDIAVARGEFVAIVGKSGSGKSTLLHMLGGLDKPTGGDIFVEGENIAAFTADELAVYRRRRVGFIFQAYNLIPSLSVYENAVLPLGLDGRAPDKAFIDEAMAMLGIAGKRDSLPATLSGGQQQRAAILRALAGRPAIVLADEPTGNLDTATGDEVIALLKLSARTYGQTLLVITHDEDLAQMADRIIVLEDGKVVR